MSPEAHLGRMGRFPLQIVIGMLCLLASASGQQPAAHGSAQLSPQADHLTQPAALQPLVPEVQTAAPVVPEKHPFWDGKNILLFSGIAVVRGMDYASTRNMQARGREEILLAHDVVNNSAAFASLEAAATLTSVGVSYIFHRTGHHKLERWMSIGHISVTAFGDVRNYCLQSKHPH